MDRPALRDGRIAVSQGRIVWIGKDGDPGEPEGPLVDLGCGVLLPGLVNAHCHLELSHLRDLDRSGGFVPWVERVVASRGLASDKAVAAATADAVAFLEHETATAAIADVSNTLGPVNALADSVLRAVVLHELIGWDPENAEEILTAAEGRLASLPAELAARGVEVRLAAHAPYSVSPALFEALRRRGGPAALHLAESPDETRFLACGEGVWAAFLERRGLGHVGFRAPGLSPVRYAASLGILRPGVVVAHCVQVDAADLEILARSGVAVAICLSSNRNLGVGVPRVPAMLAAGVKLCLGTDSLASGDGLDVMGEVVGLRRQFPELAPQSLLRMATTGGAEALGLADLGSLAPGRRAALAYAAAVSTPEDPFEFLVSGDARPRRLEA
jgi:cytosine/adenosine deaminase-related metal-dependent hydrolase